MWGLYYFGDWISGKIWTIEENEDTGEWSPMVERLQARFPVVSFGEDEDGELYVVDYGGKVYRLVDDSEPIRNERSDINQDGKVNAKDLLQVLKSWRKLADTPSPTPTPTNNPEDELLGENWTSQ